MQNFNLHQHTYRCKHADFGMTDEEYIQEYLENGNFKKIAFTDHCPEKEVIDKREHMRMSYDERLEYLEELKILKEKYKDKIEILSGYEIEFLPGQEENLKELKRETDFLVLGQHFIYDENGKDLKIIYNHIDIYDKRDMEEYASYIEKALELELPNIVAHPDLFMKAKDKFDDDCIMATRRICEAAEKYDVPLEINLNNIFGSIFLNKEDKTVKKVTIEEQEKLIPKVSYPCKEFWKIASEYNIRVVYGIDTHFRNQISLYDNLVELANKIIGEDIINKLNFIEEM